MALGNNQDEDEDVVAQDNAAEESEETQDNDVVVSEDAQLLEAAQADISALEEVISLKDEEIANLKAEIEAITAAKAVEKKDPPAKMEKPGFFYAAVSRIPDPYSERVFYPDESRATEVRPMTSWVDCQIKAGVLLRAKG